MQPWEAEFPVHVRNEQHLLPVVHPAHRSPFGRKLTEGLGRLPRRLADMKAHQVARLVVEKHAEKDEVDDWTEFVCQTSKKSLYLVMRRNGARDPAQSLVARLRERFACVGLVGGMHGTAE